MQRPPEPTDQEPRNRHERRAAAAGRLAYSVDELAEEADVGRSKIYEELRSGRLRAKKLGRRTLITAEAADEWFAQLPDYQAP
jgi:excisionase family DNA binding protein